MNLGRRRPADTKEDTIPPQATEEATLIDELEATREVEYIEFELGDHVVYPHHGAGKVLKKEEMEMLGERREYLTIKILHNDMTVRVPTENAALAGLRRVIDEETVQKVLDVLRAEVSEMPKNWNRRFKHNRDKIKTGDIYELAEVVRNLALRESLATPLRPRPSGSRPNLRAAHRGSSLPPPRPCRAHT